MKTIKDFENDVNELSVDEFYEIFTPNSYYNSGLKYSINSLYYNEYYLNQLDLIDIYETLKSLDDDINEIIFAKYLESQEKFDDDEIDDYLGFEHIPVVSYFLTGRLEPVSKSFMCVPYGYKTFII